MRTVLSFAKGRDLLDAAGLALANFAESRQIIGQEFAIRDRFNCEIKQGGLDMLQSLIDDRDFLAAGNAKKPFDSFQSGIGPERLLQIAPKQGNSCLSLSLLLYENAGCAADAPQDQRYVDLKVQRLYYRDGEGRVREPDLLEARRLVGWNPACEDKKSERERPMTISAARS